VAAEERAAARRAAYAVESDKVWSLFKERKYTEADALLVKLADNKDVAAYQADLEAAKLLRSSGGGSRSGSWSGRGSSSPSPAPAATS